MNRCKLIIRTITSIFIIFLIAGFTGTAKAEAISPSDLMNSVNALRISQGLQPFAVDIGLMSSAQGQSDYQAQLGYWTHEGAGGTSPRDRAIASGFGGGSAVFISENVAVMSSSGTLDNLIYKIWADSIHWNTMTNPQYTHAGVGVAEKSGNYYYTLDVGYIAGVETATTDLDTPQPQATYGTPIGFTKSPEVTELSRQVETVTPQEDGTIIHTVHAGEALWSIAIAYGVKVDDLVRLNNLSTIKPIVYVGQKLRVRSSFTPTVSPTTTATPRPPTRTQRPTQTKRPSIQPATAGPSPTSTTRPLLPGGLKIDFKNQRSLGLIIVVICGLGLLTVLLSGFWSKQKK